MRNSNRRFSRHGYTITELLVSIAIIAILLALLFPAIQQARESARRSTCKNNLKQIGLALHNYSDVFGQFPIGAGLGIPGFNSFDPGLHRKGSVLVSILPYLDQAPFYLLIDFQGDVVTQFESDPSLCGTSFPVYTCPSDDHPKTVLFQDVQRGLSNYGPSQGSQIMVANYNSCSEFAGNIFGTGSKQYGDTANGELISGVFGRSVWSAHTSDVTDGTSNTIAFGEIRVKCSDHPSTLGWYTTQAWLLSTSVPINFPTCPNEGPGNGDTPPTSCNSWSNWTTSSGFKSRHPGGAHFTLCDGSVRFINENIDFLTYQAIGDRRDGTAVGDF